MNSETIPAAPYNRPSIRSSLLLRPQEYDDSSPSRPPPRDFPANEVGSRQRHLLDWARLAPGEIHNLAIVESILDGTFARFQAAGKDPAYQGEPSIPSILFSTDGKPGPSIKELLNMVHVDNADDTHSFAVHGWRKTYWPGCATSSELLQLSDDQGKHVTSWVASQLHLLIRIYNFLMNAPEGEASKHSSPLRYGPHVAVYGPQVIDNETRPFDLLRVQTRHLRLMAMSYYRNKWVPVLALEVAPLREGLFASVSISGAYTWLRNLGTCLIVPFRYDRGSSHCHVKHRD
ncbi:hypothetical protein BKA70DRAFT_1314545 [Coprinopsis sp. MPI-PUGE-AT-0042]|nr:hypothetical protein BKA70DRAFT_1314545 [Coprinopsis sp. MPI-PUGE-AT-0042]